MAVYSIGNPLLDIKTQCGYVAIIGRPNVGKSTLLNHILGQKISITCRKPQTTRHQILGVKTEHHVQALYVDTPGLHQDTPRAINRVMNKAALSIIHDVDVIVLLVDARWTKQEDWIVVQLAQTKCPVILALNKVDKVQHKADILPMIKAYAAKMKFTDIIPLSAKQGTAVDVLEKCVNHYLPNVPFLFSEDDITDKSTRFMVAEIIREKLMRCLGQELPYSVAVEIDQFKENKEMEQVDIVATILIERQSQKAIIIGAKGVKLKEIGRMARLDINTLLECRCHLTLWVKVKSGWADDERALKGLGYDI